MPHTPLTADNSAVVLIDHEVGFSNLIGSHTIEENLNGTLALAKTAKLFDLPLIVTAGPEDFPAGPLYPAIEAAGRKKLIMAGIQTDVCLALTGLTAPDRGYEVYIVVDASAATTKETHDTAVMRLVQAGAIPVNWLAVGSEILRGWVDQPLAPAFGELIYEHLPSWRHDHVASNAIAKYATK